MDSDFNLSIDDRRVTVTEKTRKLIKSKTFKVHLGWSNTFSTDSDTRNKSDHSQVQVQ